jgi:Tfp pilus assembly protein PilX
MNTPRHEQGWVLPMALLGLAVVSGLATGAWRHAQHGAQGFGHVWQHEQSRQQAHAQLQAGESAWRQGLGLPAGVQARSLQSTDGGELTPAWRLQRFTATGAHGDSRVVLQSTWLQALDEHGQIRPDVPPQRLSWREVWP